MSNTFGLHPQLLRGLQLKDLGRYADAETAIKEALAQEPNDAFALHQLAACQFHQPGRQREALATIDAAISNEPNDPDHHVLRSFILSSMRRAGEALTAAHAARELAPQHSVVYTAEAQAYLHLENWALAEQSARQALAWDADNSAAANQLAQALRLQNKLDENASHLAGMLARDPEDPYTHSSAGWSALQRGERRKAEEHFLEALRLDPEMESARQGLLTSFRARSPIYRGYLSYTFAMQRLSKNARWAVIIGLYLAFRFAHTLLNGPLRPFAIVFCVLYVLFALWGWVARGVGNFILLWDRFARHVLHRAEKIEAVFVGVGVLAGVPMAVGGSLLNNDTLFVIGTCLAASAFPLSMTFTNEAPAGRWIFGTIGFAMLALAPVLLADMFFGILPQELGSNIFTVGLIICLGTTWAGNVSGLRRTA